MSGEAILVAGLPGSGKTTYLCGLCRDGWLVFDDFKANAYNNCSAFRMSRKYEALLAGIRNDLKCAVADIDFCRAASRQEAERTLLAAAPGAKLSWHFFANDSTACEANIKRRGRPSLDADLKELHKLSAEYSIPTGALVLCVVSSVS